MHGFWGVLKGNRNRVLLGWRYGGVTLLATVFCVSFTLRYASATEEISPETLALALAEAYRHDDRNAISFLSVQIDGKFENLLESGALEKVVGLMQVVAPAAAKWAARNESTSDEARWWTSRMLNNWQSLKALARNQSKPKRIVLEHPLAKDEELLQISVEGDESKTKAEIYRSSNSGNEWIGETPQYVILYPGLLITPIVDLVLDNGRVRVDDLQDGRGLLEELLGRMPGTVFFPPERGEFDSSFRQRYPISSMLQPQENGVPSLVIPILPTLHLGISGGGPATIGGAHYRKIQIESNPTGASISINGRLFGTTPRTIVMTLQTIHMILRKPGYLENVAQINVTEPVTEIHADLNPIP